MSEPQYSLENENSVQPLSNTIPSTKDPIEFFSFETIDSKLDAIMAALGITQTEGSN